MQEEEGSPPQSSPQSSQSSSCCPVCLGVFHPTFPDRLAEAVAKAVEPYYCKGGGDVDGDVDNNTNYNRFSRIFSPPVLNLPGDLAYRFRIASSSSKKKKSAAASSSSSSLADFVNALKRRAASAMNDCLCRIDEEQQRRRGGVATTAAAVEKYPPCVDEEEQGYLSVYVHATPRNGISRPVRLLRGLSANGNNSNKRRRDRKNRQRQRHLDAPSQGGDPRENLELRLNRKGVAVWSINRAVASIGGGADALLEEEDPSRDAADLMAASVPVDASSGVGAEQPVLLDFHVAVWRRPFYLKGAYTKTRRDVSQTPFYATDCGSNGTGKRRKLGSSSVEEEIAPAVARRCGGISTSNADPTTSADAVVFGMVKFHASGREDMDVRMLLPDPSCVPHGTAEKTKITGRPFVCEIIDALRLPTLADLRRIVDDINCNSTATASTEQVPSACNQRWYGNNPRGVGISDDFAFVPSSSFKNLQAEAENKVKYYGCLCWSQNASENVEELQKQLEKTEFPLELRQRTPLRVLHRRANTVRIRRVLACRITERIDEHYFRLHLSTDAGTYVKEFVTGDLGRTQPNLSVLLGGCKTDILELDCEGIAA